MKFFKNALSPSTLLAVHEELDLYLKEYRWRSSTFNWPESIKVGITGTCLATLVSDKIKAKIVEDIESKFGSYNKLTVQYCVWEKHSGISPHNDEHYKFGATIYLCKDWLATDGGLFMYAEDGELKATCPSYNTMVLNDAYTDHCVTPVSGTATQQRFTLQIWGE